ncbi:fanconi anemia group m protein-like, partial [Plakobranchus ocellatus]
MVSIKRQLERVRTNLHTVTPIPASPQHDVGNVKSIDPGEQGKWLQKNMEQKSSLMSRSKRKCSDLDEDDLDDFDVSEAVSFKKSPVVTSRKKKRKQHIFIEEEADVSGDPGSSDEGETEDDDDDDDDHMNSFINNHSETQGPDMHAMYLKSVKSPLAGGRYKLQFNARKHRHEDIYSQAPEEDQGLSEYEEDSFCVANDEEEDDLEMESQPKKVKKQKAKKSRKTKQVTGKRVIRMLDTSSEEEGLLPVAMTQEFQTSSSKQPVLLSSDDEDEKERTDRVRKKVRRIVEDTLSQVENPSEKSLLDASVESPSEHKEKFTILKESHQNSNDQESQAEKLDVPFQDGDFNLLDDDWLHELDFAPAIASQLKSEKEDKSKPNVSSSKFLDIHKNSNSPALPQEVDFKSENPCLQKPIISSGDCQTKHLVNSSAEITDSTGRVSSLSTKHRLVSKQQANFCISSDCSDNGNHRANPTAFSASVITTRNSSQTYNVATAMSNRALSREERLQRQREKQERFRQKLAQAQERRGQDTVERSCEREISSHSRTSSSSSTSKPSAEIKGAQTTRDQIDSRRSPQLNRCNPAAVTTPSGDFGNHASVSGLTTHNKTVTDANARENSNDGSGSKEGGIIPHKANNSPGSDKMQLQVLVDSREVSAAQDIISSLRLTHGIVVTARRLSSCDYIVSNFTAVDRMSWSNFSNSNHRSKLSSRLNEMQVMYERCVLIVEDDRVKAGQDKSKKQV